MKVIFPNTCGYKLPDANRVANLQKSYKFSNGYAEFLITQNGFDFDKLKEYPNNRKYLSKSLEKSNGRPDLRVLYGFDSGDKYYDLQDNLIPFLFDDVFFPIGVDHGGNELVEILAGQFKGHIASLDHEMYCGSSSLDKFVEEFELDGFHDASLDDRADMLANEDLGVAWIVSPSIQDFTESCIHCDDDFSGFIVGSID